MFLRETAFILVLILDMVFTECSVGCQSCSGSTCTYCESSYFLSNGFCSLCPDDCERCNSYDDCTSCKPSKYGLHARCTFNCDGNCINSECQDDTGYCTQCEPGLYGYKCQHNCSFCADERCGLRTCSTGCRASYYEYKSGPETLCQNCPSNCKHCTKGKTCYICDDGFYPYKHIDNVDCVKCYQTCPDCVIQGCNQCQVHNVSLVCTACPEGQLFNGETCEVNRSQCSIQCSTYCDSNGICQGECNEGWTGEKCSEKCNSKCLKCTKEKGNSCLLCKGNFYSTDCSLACNPACIVISGKHTCEHTGGYCLNGCNQTFWGDTCDKYCPVGCKDRKCDKNNGACTDGCEDGLTGETCTQTTPIETSITTTTSTTTTSDEPLIQQQTCARCDDKANIFTIGYCSGFGSCATIVVFAVLFYLIRRRYVARKTQENNKPNIEIPTYYNTRTDFGAVNAESADVTHNYESLSNNTITDNVYDDLGTKLS